MIVLSLLLLVFPLLSIVVAQTRELQLYPGTNYSLFEGQNAFFNCSSLGFDTIQWSVESKALFFYKDDPDLSYKLDDLTIINGHLVSTLNIQGTVKYNNSVISCIATELFVTNNGSDWIDTHFLIQGAPGKVLNFQGDNLTDTSLRFWWSPPFHNPGIPPCCNNYSINVTNIDSGVIVFSDHSTTNTSVEFSVSLEELCSLYSIQISAYNDVGQGDILDTTWSRGGFFRANEATESLFYTTSDDTPTKLELYLGVDVTIEGYCLNDLDNMTLSVECQSVTERLKKTRDIQADKTERELQRNIDLVIPDSHKDRTCAYDVGLENNVDLPKNPFSTYDTRSADVYSIPGMLCASCEFLPMSPGMGCVLVASRDGISSSGIEYVRNVSINDEEGCVELPEGRYRARIHDWQPGGRRSEGFMYSEVIDVSPAREIVPSPSSDVVNSGLSSGVIAGIAVGFVIAVVFIVVLVIVIVFFVCKKTISGGGEVPQQHGREVELSETNQIQIDSSKSGTVELNTGEDVHAYDHLMQRLQDKEIDLSKWDYQLVKLDHGEKDNYRYVLITQSIDRSQSTSRQTSQSEEEQEVLKN